MNQQPDSTMSVSEAYAGQFRLPPDTLHIAIPRAEIVAEMRRSGEEATVDRVCMAVALVLDALEGARNAA